MITPLLLMVKVHLTLGYLTKITVLIVALTIHTFPSLAEKQARIVPQLELTGLSPRQILFAPDDDNLLLVDNEDSQMVLFDYTVSTLAPVKIAEIAASALDAVENFLNC